MTGGFHIPNIGIIFGGLFGLLALLALAMGFVICNFRRKKYYSDVFQDVPGMKI
jgi:hypothetical protein